MFAFTCNNYHDILKPFSFPWNQTYIAEQYCNQWFMSTVEKILTLIRMAGAMSDFRNFDQVYLKLAWSTINI